MLLKNRSELLFPLSRQKIPIVFEIQSSEPINYSEIKCQITLHLIFFSRMGWIFCKIILFTRPMQTPILRTIFFLRNKFNYFFFSLSLV